VKTLAELQTKCRELGLTVQTSGRPSKEPWIVRLRRHYWEVEYPDKELPPQIEPMLLGDWADLDPREAKEIAQLMDDIYISRPTTIEFPDPV
jgi:hypothetical protein